MEADMKKQLKGILAAIAPVVCLGIWGGSAKADSLQIYVQEDGVGVPFLIASAPGFDTASFTGTFGDFKISLLAGSADNDASLSDLLSSQLSVTNTSGSEHTLGVLVTEDGYTLPDGSPLLVESGMGGSVNNGTLGLNNLFQAYFDPTNQLIGLTGGTNGPQSATLNGSTFDTGSAFGFYSRTGAYSLTSLTKLDLGGGSKINYSEHINVTVPLPSAAWGGLGLMGALFLARRRAQA
jgi:hypothetical protein